MARNIMSMQDIVDEVTEQRDALLAAAKLALNTLDNITSEEFSRGGDRPARDALNAAIAQCPCKPPGSTATPG